MRECNLLLCPNTGEYFGPAVVNILELLYSGAFLKPELRAEGSSRSVSEFAEKLSCAVSQHVLHVPATARDLSTMPIHDFVRVCVSVCVDSAVQCQ